jgi:hypothetical protein
MAEPTQIPINLDPHAYAVTNLSVTATEEEVAFQLSTGSHMKLYMLTPKHAKRVMLLLEKVMGEYEGKYGKLDTSLPKQIDQTTPKKLGFDTSEIINEPSKEK